MNKYVGFGLGVLVGIVLGAMVGLRCGRPCEQIPAPAETAPVAVPLPAAPPVVPPASEQEKVAVQAYLLSQQGADTDESDLNAALESAQQGLEKLLADYSRQSQESPGRDLAMDKAMTHARLARVALPQGDPIGYERHLAIALELSGEPNEESLFKKLDLLDEAFQNQVTAP